MKNQMKTVVVGHRYDKLESLRRQIDLHCPHLNVTGAAGSPTNAYELIKESTPQVVFVEADMPDQASFDLLDCFPDRNFITVFVAENPNTKLKALKAGAFDFLIRPVTENALQLLSERIFKESNGTSNGHKKEHQIALAHSGGFQMVHISEIIKLIADDNYTYVHLASGNRFLISKTLKEFEKKLPSDIFVRPHRSHIFNMNYLKEFLHEDGGIAVLKDGSRLAVSKRKMNAFMNSIRSHSLMIRK